MWAVIKCVFVGDLTEVNPILGSAPSLGDPPFAPKVLIGSKRADEVGPQGAEVVPELEDAQGLLSNHTTAASVLQLLTQTLRGQLTRSCCQPPGGWLL